MAISSLRFSFHFLLFFIPSVRLDYCFMHVHACGAQVFEVLASFYVLSTNLADDHGFIVM